MPKTKIISEPIWIWALCVFLTFATISNLYLSTLNIYAVLFIFLPISFSLVVLFVVLANYQSCIIRLDNETIERKGLFFGYKLRIKIVDVKEIKLFYNGRNTYYELVDGEHNSYPLFNRHSSIKIPQNDKGKLFIECFQNIKLSLGNCEKELNIIQTEVDNVDPA